MNCRHPWSETQRTRLKALGADKHTLDIDFETEAQRDADFQKRIKTLVRKCRDQLIQFRDETRRPFLCQLEHRIADRLLAEGFVQVTTPLIMSGGHLRRMGIGADHELHRQIFWADDKRCFRPMLAPHLYYVSTDLLRLWPRPVSLFEIGPCFRKESQGAQHMNEFTMLNLVEYGMPAADRIRRLEEMADIVMETAGVEEYCIEKEQSEVYGETTDILAGSHRLEVASAAMGPHPLDDAWGVTDTWVGIGFGLERLVMVAQGLDTLKKCGRSLTFLNGTPLNV